MPTVALPDGRQVQFPEGTPIQEMERAMAEFFPQEPDVTMAGAKVPEFAQPAARTALSAAGGFNKGLANTIAIPVDLLNMFLRGIGIPNVREEPLGPSIQKGMESVGVRASPLEGTRAQRLAGAAGEGAGAASVFGPGAMVAGAGGGLAAGTAKEAGASPATQIGAAALGGLGVATAANLAAKTTAAVTGSQVAPRVAAMRAEGITPRMAGDVAGSRVAQQLTAKLQDAPITGSIIQKAAQQTRDEIAAAIENRAASYGAGTSPEIAGKAIERGVKGYADTVKARADVLYDRLGKTIPAITPVTATNTTTAVGELVSKMPNLPATAESLTPTLFKRLADDLSKNGTPTFGELSALRTEVGKRLSDPWLIDDVGRADLKRLYAATTLDLRDTAANIGPRALKEFDDSAKFYKQQMDFLEGAFQKFGSLGVTPEKMYQWAIAEGRLGATRLRDLKRAMPQDEFGLVSSTVLRTIGKRASDGAFDPATFISNWEKLSPEAKTALFDGRQWGQYKESVDRIAAIAKDFRETGRLANTSRTAGTAQLLEWFGVLAGAGTYAGGAVGGAGAVVTQAATQAAFSKLLVNPAFAVWLSTPIPAGGIPRHVALLAPMAARYPEIADLLKQFTDQISQMTGQQENGAQQ